MIEWIEATDLPQLQSAKLGHKAFEYCHSVVFESDRMGGMIIQICQNYNSFILVIILLEVIVVMIDE